MKLFYARGTIALASLIALEDTGAPYTVHSLDFSQAEENAPAYLEINPKGRVPALETADGILTETPAILTWIADSHPAAGLLPVGHFQRARCLEFMSYIASTVHVNHAHRMRGHRWADDRSSFEDMQRRVPGNMRDSLQLVEDALDGEWVLGRSYTVCDPYLYTICTWLEGDGVDVNDLPRIASHMHRMQARPAVQRAHAI
ncbi:MAG: glutathione S-transferase N-terminal domain-containing protein [Pseudomonadota bacterium]